MEEEDGGEGVGGGGGGGMSSGGGDFALRHEMSRLVLEGKLAAELSRALAASVSDSSVAVASVADSSVSPQSVSSSEITLGTNDSNTSPPPAPALSSWKTLIGGGRDVDSVAHKLEDSSLRSALLRELDAARNALVATGPGMCVCIYICMALESAVCVCVCVCACVCMALESAVYVVCVC